LKGRTATASSAEISGTLHRHSLPHFSLCKKWSKRQDLNLPPPADNQGIAASDTQGDSQTPVTSLHDLSQVVKAWPRLSAPLKAAILAIVATATQ